MKEKVTAAMRRAGARVVRKWWKTPATIEGNPMADASDLSDAIYRAMRDASARERTRKKR